MRCSFLLDPCSKNLGTEHEALESTQDLHRLFLHDQVYVIVQVGGGQGLELVCRTYSSIRIHTYACACRRIHTYNVYIHTYIHTYIHIYIHTYIHTYIRMYARTHARTHARTYVRTYVRACMHA